MYSQKYNFMVFDLCVYRKINDDFWWEKENVFVIRFDLAMPNLIHQLCVELEETLGIPALRTILKDVHINVKLVWRALGKWVKSVISVDDHRHLGCVAAKTQRPPPLGAVVLWIDSTDFRIKGKRSVHRDKSQWSHKLKSPGRRWLTITNAKAQVQWVAGPYKPTQYDGDLTVLNVATLDMLFGRSHMVGDNHFKKAGEFFSKITLFTNISKGGRPKTVDGKKVPVTLTKEEEELNEKISLVRGKVEAPYGWVKQHFSALSKPFFESEKQHHCLVLYSFAVHRIVVSKKK